MASVSESDRRLRYGGPWFSAASALPIEGDMVRVGPLCRFLAAALRRPSRIAALIALLLRTRLVSLELSNSLPGRALCEYFSDRSFGLFPRHQRFQGVLVLPRDHAVYLRGHRRQALRTNLRHAAAAGISCEEITDRSRGLDDVADIVGQRDESMTEDEANAWRERVAQPELTLVVARSANGCPLAAAGVVVDDTVCLIRFAVASDHWARWALHDHLVRLLIARGVSYLLVEGGGPFGALEFEANVQHYQHLLGYELRHLTLSTPRCVYAKTAHAGLRRRRAGERRAGECHAAGGGRGRLGEDPATPLSFTSVSRTQLFANEPRYATRWPTAAAAARLPTGPLTGLFAGPR